MGNLSISPHSGRRGRHLSFDRAHALAVALRLFWARGYEGASVAELVAAMGITPPSLYTAFGSKAALYEEALGLYRDSYAGFVFRALSEEATARGSIDRLLSEAATAYCDPAIPNGCMISTAVLSCAPEHREIAGLVATMRTQTVEALAARFDRAKDAGELPREVDGFALARFFAAVIQGMSIQARDGADAAALLAIARNAMHAWPVPNQKP